MEVKEQLVSLKVMRLLKPSMYTTLPVYTETKHSNEFSNILIDQVFNIQSASIDLNNSPDSSQTDFLVIPQNFGNLYIGETFTSYICLYNQSIHKVKDLNIKIELQTTSLKIPLKFNSTNTDTLQDFEPDQKFDGIVEHDVKELGNHILICIVSYLNEKGENLSFKKFYKFNVSKPFEIQPTYPFDKSDYHSQNNQSLILQAQIQNVTNNFLLMDKVQLQPVKQGVKITKLESNREATNTTTEILKPFEIKQYMFKILNEDLEKDKKPSIGKLDISWRYSFGEHGHLQTLPLEPPPEYSSQLYKDIELKFERVSDECYLEEPIDLICEIKNKSERDLDLVMRLENSLDENNSRNFFWNCSLVYHIGNLEANKSVFVDLTVVPLCTGLLRLHGITITDLFLKRKHEFNPFLNVFVITKENSSSFLKEVKQDDQQSVSEC